METGGEVGVVGVNSASHMTPPSTFLLSPLFLPLSCTYFIQFNPILVPFLPVFVMLSYKRHNAVICIRLPNLL